MPDSAPAGDTPVDRDPPDPAQPGAPDPSTLDGEKAGGRYAGMEIERKYLLHAFPARLHGLQGSTIDQGYLPGVRLIERVRRVRDHEGRERYWRTVKDGTGVSRLEIEEETDAALFAALWPLTAGRRVQKVRYVVPEGDLRWEVDRFTDRDLVLAEVELRDPEQQPELPAWLAEVTVREVTGEDAYVNANLAR